MRNRLSPGIIPIAVIMFLLPWILNIDEYRQTEHEKMTVHFIDVGQGDCELIDLPHNRHMLIDAGDDGDTVISYINRIGIKKIDYLVATHPHADHIGGMGKIVAKYDIGEIYMPKTETTTAVFDSLLDEIEKKNLSIHTAKANDKIFDFSGIIAEFISPTKDYEDLNAASAIVKIKCDKTSFLFMADAEAQTEKDILLSGADVSCDVLKVAHHGSSSSSTKEFLKKAHPKYAVISCAKGNKYNHPHQETLDNLKRIDSTVLRTDELGTIIIKTDGHHLQVEK